MSKYLRSQTKRNNPLGDKDFYPTPHWGTRALLEHVIQDYPLENQSVWECAAGQRDMSDVLEVYFKDTLSTDINDEPSVDFLKSTKCETDWIITNPPFNIAVDFVQKCLELKPKVGFAMFLRLAFLESKTRFNTIYKDNPPSITAVFTERVSLSKNLIDPNRGSSVAYCWMVWLANSTTPQLKWIPPCKAELTI